MEAYDEVTTQTFLSYDGADFCGYCCRLSYVFKDGRLEQVHFVSPEFNEAVQLGGIHNKL